jgi:hypothetical protein
MRMTEEKPKRKPKYDPNTIPCPVCGETDYEWGTPGSDGGVYYLPQGAIFGFGGGEGLAARKCLACGNMQLFIKEMYDTR